MLEYSSSFKIPELVDLACVVISNLDPCLDISTENKRFGSHCDIILTLFWLNSGSDKIDWIMIMV